MRYTQFLPWKNTWPRKFGQAQLNNMKKRKRKLKTSEKTVNVIEWKKEACSLSVHVFGLFCYAILFAWVDDGLSLLALDLFGGLRLPPINRMIIKLIKSCGCTVHFGGSFE